MCCNYMIRNIHRFVVILQAGKLNCGQKAELLKSFKCLAENRKKRHYTLWNCSLHTWFEKASLHSSGTVVGSDQSRVVKQ